MEGGATRYCEVVTEELKNKTYKPMPVKRAYIPKPDGTKRPLGIPKVKDRVVQMAVKIVIEPIFEADFQNSSYGFRPGRSSEVRGDICSRYQAIWLTIYGELLLEGRMDALRPRCRRVVPRIDGKGKEARPTHRVGTPAGSETVFRHIQIFMTDELL